jgi:hypothetical protein
MTPLLLEDYARSTIRDRLSQARHDALAAQARRRPSREQRALPPFATAARLRLANGLRSLACRLDPCVVGDSRLLISR